MSLQEQRRARFEAYIRAKYPQNARIILEILPGTTGYRWADTVQRLEDWNAALDGVVIELPEPGAMDACPATSAEFDQGYSACATHCRTAIEAAGLKVAP